MFGVSLALVMLKLWESFIFTDALDSLLEKNGRWIKPMLKWAGLILFETALVSWLPGRTGMQIVILDDVEVFTDGAVFRNLGVLLLLHAAGVGLAAAKHVWAVIRKRKALSGRLLFLEIVSCAASVLIGIKLVQSDYVMQFEGGEEAGNIVMILLALIGGGGFLYLFWDDRKQKNKAKTAVETPHEEQPPAAEAVAPMTNTDARFNQIIAEKNRLTGEGDYASQIPLLIEATGLDVDEKRKRRIWNLLGIAYEQVGSADRAAECYHTAQRFDPESPSCYNNLGLLHAKKGEYGIAARHMHTALEKANKRNQNLGLYYANYARVLGKSGDLPGAKEMLRLASQAGYDRESVEDIKKQIGV